VIPDLPVTGAKWGVTEKKNVTWLYFLKFLEEVSVSTDLEFFESGVLFSGGLHFAMFVM
jgi:hypothetical protein